jgi:hypothetical protein
MTWVEKVGLVILLFGLVFLNIFHEHWASPVFVMVASVGVALFLVGGKGGYDDQ